MKKIFGIIVLIYAIVFARLETEYFGNNWLPQTKEEMLCDTAVLLLVICGHILFWQKRK